jgi:hypothetical protein
VISDLLKDAISETHTFVAYGYVSWRMNETVNKIKNDCVCKVKTEQVNK